MSMRDILERPSDGKQFDTAQIFLEGWDDIQDISAGTQTNDVKITLNGEEITVNATNLDIRDLTSVSDSVSAVQSGTWTVTANAGTNLNTSALLTESTFNGRIGEVQASPTSNTVLDRLKTIADNQLADGHNVTVDNIAGSGVFVQPGTSTTWNVSDKAARLLGVVYGSQGQQLQQKVSTNDLIVTLDGETVIVDATSSGDVPVTLKDSNGDAINSLNNALNVHITDVHFELINEHFHEHQGAASTELLTVAATAGDTSITVADGTSFSVADFIQIEEGNTLENQFSKITVIATNVLTLDRPLDNDYTTAATAEVVEVNLASSVGSLASPITYILKPPADKIWHIKRLLISAVDNVAPTDDKFVGITALTNGMVLRVNNNGVFRTLTVWRNNQDMIEDYYDVEYAQRVGASDHGQRGRWTFGKVDVTIKLDGSTNDQMEILVQDNLTDIIDFQIKGQGHMEG